MTSQHLKRPAPALPRHPVRPLLQIIHISDLHVRKDYEDTRQLHLERTRIGVALHTAMRRLGPVKWNEGTLSHDRGAARAFADFLQYLRSEKEWFPTDTTESSPRTWLVDTGDATTFGDGSSMREAHRLLEQWRGVLDDCEILSLFGNHDLWPGTQPVLRSGPKFDAKMGVQRQLIEEQALWSGHPGKPLSLVSPEGIGIELFALNTCSESLLDGFLARGDVTETALRQLAESVSRCDDKRTIRLLATHHPMAYPYPHTGAWAPMIVNDSAGLSRKLRNVELPLHNVAHRPLAHVLLAGHTHEGYPAEVLGPNIKDIIQRGLGEDQVQFVAGSLMLSQGMYARDEPAGLKKLGELEGFRDPAVLLGSQQFEMLRFYMHEKGTESYVSMERFPLVRKNSGDYAVIPELVSEIDLDFVS